MIAARLGDFVSDAAPPEGARARAATALLDTVGVTLAGASEPVSLIVQQVIAAEGGDACGVFGTADRASMSGAALANGTAAHALDYDDMCFVSLAHPSAPLVPAVLAAAESERLTGRAVLDAYVVGFEIEARLGRLMNPRHYQRGWHCTSTLGTIGAAAAVSRLLGLDARAAGHALAIAASEASGLKENFGTMVKPLHAGLAARNGVLAALLARGGMTASDLALDGPQGLLHAMDSEGKALADAIADLGARWEILDTGITVKLYPSCAGTHPSLDAILDLRRREGFSARRRRAHRHRRRLDRADDPDLRPSGDGARRQVQPAVLRRRGRRLRPRGYRYVRRGQSHQFRGDGADGARRDAGRSGARSRRSAAHPRARARHPARWTRADPGGAGRAGLSGTAGHRCTSSMRSSWRARAAR